MAKKVKIKEFAGQTYPGAVMGFSANIEGETIDITGADILMQFRRTSKTGELVYEIKVDEGITIIDSTTAAIDEQLLPESLTAGTYFADVEVTQADGYKGIPIETEWQILATT
jgi:hypothetical protein